MAGEGEVDQRSEQEKKLVLQIQMYGGRFTQQDTLGNLT